MVVQQKKGEHASGMCLLQVGTILEKELQNKVVRYDVSFKTAHFKFLFGGK